MNFLRLIVLLVLIHIGWNFIGASVKVARGTADRLAVTICEVSQDCH